MDRSLSVLVIRDLDMNKGHAFSFPVTNPSAAQLSPAVSIRVAGPVPIALQAMSPDLTTDLSSEDTCHDPCFVVLASELGNPPPPSLSKKIDPQWSHFIFRNIPQGDGVKQVVV